MKVLVTGGAGYIGSHTIIELLNAGGFEVISADNYCNSSLETFDRIEEITSQRIHNFEVDLADPQQCIIPFEKHPDIAAVIHFAALKSVPESVKDPGLYKHNNMGSLQNIIDCYTQFGFPCLIFSSSCSVYGNIATLPVTEESPLQEAESPYGWTKQEGEKLLVETTTLHKGLQCVALRYFNPVGAHLSGLNGELPQNRPNNLLPVITQTAAGVIEETVVFGSDYPTRDGTCVRDYVHVTDIASAHVQALQHLLEQRNENNYEVFNLGTGNGVSVLEAIHAFEKTTGQTLNYRIGSRREGDVVAIYSDCAKAKEELGWEAKLTIEDMMDSAWKWQRHITP